MCTHVLLTMLTAQLYIDNNNNTVQCAVVRQNMSCDVCERQVYGDDVEDGESDEDDNENENENSKSPYIFFLYIESSKHFLK